VVDEVTMWSPARARAGDHVVGVSSSGFHSNGYSLLRRVFEKDISIWLDQLMTPTALYPALVSAIRADLELGAHVRSSAHITGGGMENLPRAYGPGLELKLQRWAWPTAFTEVMKRTQVSEVEMIKTLNCGVGFAFVVDPARSEALQATIKRKGFQPFMLGELTSHEGKESTIDYSLWESGGKA